MSETVTLEELGDSGPEPAFDSELRAALAKLAEAVPKGERQGLVGRAIRGRPP